MAKPKRGIVPMRVGLAMLVFGTAFALAGGLDPKLPIVGSGLLAAFAGLLTTIIGLGIYREKPDKQ
ncbi:hypothetical protein [Neomicrococcus lactis]|uniref:hypothetical protein n=1 Tax=Neomicrococcus lactis TaxID=732241 RepID=UPI0023002101|nr:hypothetical protein [Neomicrococcus lactis]